MQDEKTGLENFNLDHQLRIEAEHILARPGSVLVAVRGNTLEHLRRTLQKTNLRRHDIVVMTVRPLSTGAGEFELNEDQIFSAYEQELFSRVVELAEKEGKHVELLVTSRRRSVRRDGPGGQQSQGIEIGHRRSQSGWPQKSSRSISDSRGSDRLNRGTPFLSKSSAPTGRPPTSTSAHPPRLWPDDIDRLHEIWLRLSAQENLGANSITATSLAWRSGGLIGDLDTAKREEIVDSLEREIREHS